MQEKSKSWFLQAALVWCPLTLGPYLATSSWFWMYSFVRVFPSDLLEVRALRHLWLFPNLALGLHVLSSACRAEDGDMQSIDLSFLH